MKTKTLFASTIVALNLLFAASVPVAAVPTTWYIATGGNDSNPCTQALPCRSINHVASKTNPLAQPGDTVSVAPGTYDENNSAFGAIVTYASGTSYTSMITYKSQVRWGAVIIQADNSTSHPSAWTNYGNYVVIDGFDFAGKPVASPSLAGVNGVALAGADGSTECVSSPSPCGHHSILRNSRVHGFVPDVCNGTGGSGVNVHATDIQIIANVIYGNGPKPCQYVHGIYWKDQYGLVAENIIYGNGGHGIQEWNSSSDITVVNNTIFSNGYSGVYVSNDRAGSDGGPTKNSNGFVDSNIVYGNGTHGIAENCPDSCAPGSQTCCLAQASQCPSSIGRYGNNVSYFNTLDNINLVTGSDSGSTIQSDPLFINNQLDGTGIYMGRPSLNGLTGSGNTSPALDAGLKTDTNACGSHNHFSSLFSPYDFPAYDFSNDPTNHPRPDNGGVNFDVGAWESSY